MDIIALVICSLVALIFVVIGVVTWNSKEAAGFFSGVKPPNVSDVKAYNHAVGILWFVYAGLFEAVCIPLTTLPQDSPYALLGAGIIVALCICLVIAYTVIEARYRV